MNWGNFIQDLIIVILGVVILVILGKEDNEMCESVGYTFIFGGVCKLFWDLFMTED